MSIIIKFEDHSQLLTMGITIDASDRISQLSNDILHHSLIPPARVAVCVNVLFKTWHRVLTSIPLSEFSEAMLLLNQVSGEQGSDEQDRRDKFIDFLEDSLHSFTVFKLSGHNLATLRVLSLKGVYVDEEDIIQNLICSSCNNLAFYEC
ncbi:hypothetical protein SADUNF_Sadunf12G0077100 [Salix dunnii]|uniref:Uncharacterized protein n=1 Tax=Salix dunnii TaxID=1413687 RepID=A0A835MM71_9ROSI|nr:hypothetical protein SADUNF_Sadunf12G0077100 [Salix dunnii]